jgi:hypothetical protein
VSPLGGWGPDLGPFLTGKELEMTIGFLFWLLMILWLIFGLFRNWPASPGGTALYPVGGHLLLWILLFLLGWKAFGFPIHGGP